MHREELKAGAGLRNTRHEYCVSEAGSGRKELVLRYSKDERLCDRGQVLSRALYLLIIFKIYEKIPHSLSNTFNNDSYFICFCGD